MFKLKIINKPKMIKMKCNIEFPDVILAKLQEKEVIPTKEKQEIVPDHQYDGLSKVTVNPIPDEYIVPSGEIEFTKNGTYDVTDKASAKVNVPEKTLGTKTITENGTYKAIDDNLDGYSEVTVETGKYKPRYVSFYNYPGTELDNEINGLDTSDIQRMRDMFSQCTSLTSLDLSNFNTSNVTDMASTFYNCRALTSLNLNNFDTSKVVNMIGMFTGCQKIANIDVSSFDTSNVTGMSSMFNNMYALETINLSNFNTDKVRNMDSMFQNDTKLQEINLSNFTGTSLTTARNMFSGCSSLQNINISNLDTSNVNDFAYGFYNCSKLETIPKLKADKMNNITNSFDRCLKLQNFDGLENIGKAYATSYSANYSNYKLNLSTCTALTEQSIINILNNLYDIKAKGCKAQQVILGSNNLAKLTSEEGQQALSNAQTKGWTVS